MMMLRRTAALITGFAVLLLPVAAAAVEPGEGFVEVTGGRVWYRVVGSGAATPVLLLHGGPGFTSHYLEAVGRLADERPVVFYDQLGAGRSDRPEDLTLWKAERFVEELAQIRAALGLEKVHLLGHSWGDGTRTTSLRAPPWPSLQTVTRSRSLTGA
jgi:proline iminopeptidase